MDAVSRCSKATILGVQLVRIGPRRSTMTACYRPPRRGAAAVEFALVAPFLLLLLAGIIEFGQSFFIQHSLSTAARHGARAAIIDGSTSSNVTQKVQEHCVRSLGVKPGDVNVNIAVDGVANGSLSNAQAESEVTVTVSVLYAKAGVGFFANTFANSSIRSTCTLQHE